MPFDGVVTKCVVEELSGLLAGGRIEKVFQPQPDEIIINIWANNLHHKLLLSANANFPRIHTTESAGENPLNPPAFCMLLRKHLSGGRITGVEFFDYERIVALHAGSSDECGNYAAKKLIIEIMGRHSNIILVNDENRIIDSIKRVNSEISSVREVLPGRLYALPPSQDKTSPEKLDIARFTEKMASLGPESANIPLEKYLLNSIKGFSPLLCREVCHRSGIDAMTRAKDIGKADIERLKETLSRMVEAMAGSNFSPCFIFEDEKADRPMDFHCLEIRQFAVVKYMSSMCKALDVFYSAREAAERLKQKKSALMKVINTNLERCVKKLSMHQEKLREVSGREKLRLYGELIIANIYSIPSGAAEVSLQNYHSPDCEYIRIALDRDLSPQQNAQKYFREYARSKSIFESTTRQMNDNLAEIEYLENVLHAVESCSAIRETEDIREELAEQGYMPAKKKNVPRRKAEPLAPLRYKSSDGYEILVGKNNRQNDMLTMKIASSGDTWLHARNIPGSHVIIKKGPGRISETALLEAASIAAFHSRSRMSSNVPVDYTSVKNVKKPPGAKPGMVIYDNFKTVFVTPDESVVGKLITRSE